MTKTSRAVLVGAASAAVAGAVYLGVDSSSTAFPFADKVLLSRPMTEPQERILPDQRIALVVPRGTVAPLATKILHEAADRGLCVLDERRGGRIIDSIDLTP